MGINITQGKYPLAFKDFTTQTVQDYNIALRDIVGSSINADWDSRIRFSEDIETLRTIIKQFNISLKLNAKRDKIFTKDITEKVKLAVEKINSDNNVIGDIRFYDKIINETNFGEVLTPYGYGQWRRMITGDYIYSKALCKYVMQASLESDRPNTRTYKHKVDVPDVIETGTVDMSSMDSFKQVLFKREFHIAPDIRVSVASYSGTNATPITIPYDITNKGFKVTLKADGRNLNGSISYSARGY